MFLCVRVLMQESERSAAEDAFAPFGKQILPGDLSPLPSSLRPLPDIGGMEVINTGRELLGGIEVDATNVYFIEALTGDKVMKRPLVGGPAVTLGSVKWAVAIDAEGDRVFVGSLGDLMDAGKAAIDSFAASGAEAPVRLASKLLSVLDIALGGANIYFVVGGTVDKEYADGYIGKVPVAGGPTTVVARAQEPLSIAVDSTHVYWTQNGRDGAAGTVHRAPLSGGTQARVAVGAMPRMKSIAVVNGYVYWLTERYITGEEALIQRAPVSGGPEAILAKAKIRICRIAVDASGVYWADSGNVEEGHSKDGSIMKVSLEGGPPVTLTESQDGPCYLALSPTHVYFSTRSINHLKRAPKNPAGDPAAEQPAADQPLPSASP